MELLHLVKLSHNRVHEEPWVVIGDTKVNELYEYRNLDVPKSYVGSFPLNVEDNIYIKHVKKLV